MNSSSSTQLTALLVLFCWSFAQVECIIGGNSTKPNEFKSVVYIEFDKTGGIFEYCTGGIVSKNFILTAAHCVVNQVSNEFLTGRIKVIAGTNDVKNKPGIERLVKEIIVPGLYRGDEEYLKNDFALLCLAEDLDLKDKRIEALRLPLKVRNYISDKFIKHKVMRFAGFGYTHRYLENGRYRFENKFEGQLRKANVVYSEDCDGEWRESVAISAYCAKMVNNEKRNPIGLCGNDFGGPLIRGRKTVVGIAMKYDKSCNENVQPSIFTRVGQFAKALQNIIDTYPNIEGGRRKVANETGYFEAFKGETVEQIPYYPLPEGTVESNSEEDESDDE